MSIGSGTNGGVGDIAVSDLSIDGADNGIRIKSDRSRGGLVQNVSYENVCIRNVPNPVVITPWYTTFPGTRLPIYRDIVLKDVHSLTPGWVTLMGLDAEHKLGVTLDNVAIDGMRAAELHTENAEIRMGRRGNLELAGNGVTVTGAGAGTGTDATAAPLACSDRFPAFPATNAPAAAVTVQPEDKTLYVAASGTGDFYSIQHAIDVAPPEGAVISIAPGTYREALKIAKPNITLRSPYDDPRKTVIVFDKSAGTSGGTFRSATVDIHAADFTAENLTFANDFNATHLQTSVGGRGGGRPRGLPQHALPGQSGHRLRVQGPAVFHRQLHRRQRGLHLRRRQNRFRELRDPQYPSLRRIHHRAGQSHGQPRQRLRVQSL
jgi:polygalacturonase